MIRGHLRLVPKPLAKAEPRAYPPIDGVVVRRAALRERWLVERTTRGKTQSIELTRSELHELVVAIARALKERS